MRVEEFLHAAVVAAVARCMSNILLKFLQQMTSGQWTPSTPMKNAHAIVMVIRHELIRSVKSSPEI